jgi:hypothetical protein
LQKLRETRTRLLRTQLYRKVDIFPHIREDGAHIFIVLQEAVRLGLTYGVTYSTYKYGRPDFWYYPNAEVALYNFRGRHEEFSAGASLWTHRSLDLAWTKPFLSTPYYMSIGGGVAQYPDKALPVDYTDVYGAAAAGVKVSANTRVALSAMPIFRRRSVVESVMDENSHSIDFPERNNFYEAFGGVNLITDRRSARFDPQGGWFMDNGLSTNRLYQGVNTPYFEYKNETRLYLPLLFDDMAAMRFALTLRDTDAGAYHRLTYGSAGTIRGYYEEALGWQFVANSSVLMSFKYHKPIWEVEAFEMPVLNAVFRGVREISYRVDATLIADYARLYEEPLGAITFSGARQSGIGLGFGIRVLMPEIRQSGCIDFVWGRMEGIDGKTGGWEPMMHVYFDMFF